MNKISKPIVFVHVEKSGGITLNNMLHNYIPGYITPRPDYGKIFTESDLEKVQRFYPLKIIGIGGHRISSKLDYFPDQFCFSFVREPIARLVSHYNWQLNYMSIKRNLGSFIEDQYFQNFQTYRLTGCRDFKEAKQVIDNRIDFVGLTESFNDSIKLLSYFIFDRFDKLDYEKLNITTVKNKSVILNEIDSSIIRRMRELNSVDIDVYEYCKSIFYDLSEKKKIELKEVNLGALRTPLANRIKRKCSNAFIGRIIQPLIQSKVKYGY